MNQIKIGNYWVSVSQYTFHNYKGIKRLIINKNKQNGNR